MVFAHKTIWTFEAYAECEELNKIFEPYSQDELIRRLSIIEDSFVRGYVIGDKLYRVANINGAQYLKEEKAVPGLDTRPFYIVDLFDYGFRIGSDQLRNTKENRQIFEQKNLSVTKIKP